MTDIYQAIVDRASDVYLAASDLHESSQFLMHGRAMGLEEAAAIYLRKRLDEDAA